TDMFPEPASADPPRFHSLPASWAAPSRGPAASHPAGLCGPTRQADVQSQIAVVVSLWGSNDTRLPASSLDPHAVTPRHTRISIAAIQRAGGWELGLVPDLGRA